MKNKIWTPATPVASIPKVDLLKLTAPGTVIMQNPFFTVLYGIPTDMTNLPYLSYAICKNGVFEIRQVCTGSIIKKVDGIPVATEGKENVNILPKKIPASFFWKTHEFFKYVETHFKSQSLEAFILVLYDKINDSYKLHVPDQKVTAGSVNYDLEKVWEKYPDHSIILDIHSHGTNLNAFFSGTDDADDKKDRYSGVFGKISKMIPEFKFRIAYGANKIEIGAEDLFDNEDHTPVELDLADACTRIEANKPAYSAGTYNPYKWQGKGNHIQRDLDDYDAYGYAGYYGAEGGATSCVAVDPWNKYLAETKNVALADSAPGNEVIVTPLDPRGIITPAASIATQNKDKIQAFLQKFKG